MKDTERPTPDREEIVAAITALTTFLRHGSQQSDPQRFSHDQHDIEHDFRALLAGLGRGRATPPGQLVDPVLSRGHLELGADLPAQADRIGGYDSVPRRVWLVKVAEATGDGRNLYHPDIRTRGVVRLWVFDEAGERILTGVPKIAESDPETVRKS